MHLPELRRLELFGDRPVRTLRFERDSFVGASKLESVLVIRAGLLAIMPDSFVGLTALKARRKLHECGVSHIPAAVTALSGSLTSLVLYGNNALQLTSDDVARVLTLRKLRILNLQKRSFKVVMGHPAAANTVAAHLRYQPALWSPRSLQHLIELSSAFVVQHGRALALIPWNDFMEDE